MWFWRTHLENLLKNGKTEKRVHYRLHLSPELSLRLNLPLLDLCFQFASFSFIFWVLCWVSVLKLFLFCFCFVFLICFLFSVVFFWTVFFIPEVGVLWVIIFHTRNYNNLQSCISHYITIPIDSAKSGRKMTFQKILTFTVELWIYWRLPLWIIAIWCLSWLSAPLQDLDWDASAREKGAWTAGSWRLTC